MPLKERDTPEGIRLPIFLLLPLTFEIIVCVYITEIRGVKWADINMGSLIFLAAGNLPILLIIGLFVYGEIRVWCGVFVPERAIRSVEENFSGTKALAVGLIAHFMFFLCLAVATGADSKQFQIKRIPVEAFTFFAWVGSTFSTELALHATAAAIFAQTGIFSILHIATVLLLYPYQILQEDSRGSIGKDALTPLLGSMSTAILLVSMASVVNYGLVTAIIPGFFEFAGGAYNADLRREHGPGVSNFAVEGFAILFAILAFPVLLFYLLFVLPSKLSFRALQSLQESQAAQLMRKH